MVPLCETSGDSLAVDADFLVQALEKMAFVLTLVPALWSPVYCEGSLISDHTGACLLPRSNTADISLFSHPPIAHLHPK